MEDELYYDYGLNTKKELGTTVRNVIIEAYKNETITIQNLIQLVTAYEEKVKALYEKVRMRELNGE